MQIQEVVQIAQAIGPIVSAVGICFSTALAIRALNNTRQDRLLKIRPKVLFNLGAQVVSFEREKGKAIPGIDISEVRKALADLDEGIELNIPSRALAGLFNHGNGQAFNIEATFVPYTVTRGGVEGPINSHMLSRFPFSEGWNTFPAVPSHLDAGEEGQFFRIPTLAVVDYDKALQKVAGRMYIRCQDGDGQTHTSVQPVSLFMDYDISSDAGAVTFSFAKELST